ncbi:Hint domain-containing protein [Tropicimonas sp. TH_r6]|uniref:Hint domain-containing protein n=1 Tax=Tropicimonas sp. TH_r6 TaxID=3082085 RepID=UPI0029548311|nr:Hint domain-containing protein [Tropicimonas sp. TH_r6]MDV7144873.1 Hint domain-containing protein [Tropicimonas sp. TH_r6]
MATIDGDDSDNILNGTGEADAITGGAGNDTINAGGGDDVIQAGPDTISTTALNLSWSDEGGDGTDISSGFTQDTGGIDVTVGFTQGTIGTTATVETNSTYVETDDPFSSTSNLGLRGSGTGSTWTTDISFAASTGADYADEVEAVSFRIQDIDANSWQDVVTVYAYDADGNQVEVTLTVEGDDTVSGNTVTAGSSSTAATDAAGSVLVEIAGPVARIEIIYENAGSSGQLLYITDVHFDAVDAFEDDDIVYGGTGNDTIAGGLGDDTLYGEDGEDTLSGGAGDDTLHGGDDADTLYGGEANDTLYGDEGDDLLFGEAGIDILDGGTGADTLDGGSGDDNLFGGAGADTLIGGDGSDTMSGGDDSDIFYAESGDTIIGGEGGDDSNDTLIASDVDRVEYDANDPEAGTLFFSDGTTADFTEIETLVINGGPDGIVDGTSGDDVIDASYVDAQLEMVDNDDGINGTTGDEDNIQAGSGDDIIYAGEGNDTVTGGVDTLTSASESLNWTADGTGVDATTGFSQNTGLATLTVNVSDDGALTSAQTATTAQYVATGEPFATDSTLALGGDGGADVATVTIATDQSMEDVSFRINDIDSSSWEDIVTVNAYDADGNPVAVTLTAAGDDTVTGNTITGGSVNDSSDIANGSVLVEIAGPVSEIEIVYENGSTGGQVVYLTDVHFTSVQTDDDTIHGDQGDDTLSGNAGDDVIYGDQLAVDPTDYASTGGSATSVTFENLSPYDVELVEIDASGNFVSHGTLTAGASTTESTTDGTTWMILDPATDDILDVFDNPADGSTQTFDSAGTDTLDGGTGNDTLSGDWGGDTLLGGEGDDTLDGGSGDDVLTGGAGDDDITGGDGQDQIIFEDGFGTDTVDGSEGGEDLDTLDFSAMTSGVEVSFTGDEAGDANATSDASTADFTNIERVLGSDHSDVIDASASGISQILEGAGGEDDITGGSGDDMIDGGADGDTISGGAGVDSVSGGAGVDFLDGGDDTDADTIYGGDDGDVITARINDVIEGGEGGDDNDILIVAGAATVEYDVSDPEAGTITYYDDDLNVTGTATFSEIEHVYVVGAGEGNSNQPVLPADTSAAMGSLDGVVEGTDLGEIIDTAYTGDPDGDMVDGNDAVAPLSDEQDIILAGDGDDTIYAGEDADTVFGGDGADTVYGEAGTDTIDGGDGADTLFGGAGSDLVFGGDGDDTLSGDSGVTGDGGDLLSGDADQDTFIFIGDGDVIVGGETGTDYDTLDLSDHVGPLEVQWTGAESGVVNFLDSNGTVTGSAEFSEIERVVPCFTPGTLIRTAKGDIPVEDLCEGDLVLTRDNGLRPIRWFGRRTVGRFKLLANPRLRPIHIRRGALGPNVPDRDMMVSPQHRLLFANSAAHLLLGEAEVLVKAKDLTHLAGVDRLETEEVDYIHIMFDAHEIVLADNCWSESFQPGDMVAAPETREIFGELLEIFPELATEEGRQAYGAARYSTKAFEAKLVARSGVEQSKPRQVLLEGAA